MLPLYNFGIFFFTILAHLGSFFNTKTKLFIKGRKNIFQTIENKVVNTNKNIWFHFASLGEFEQGRPVLEELKKNHPKHNIIVTFFSPSGYEIRKNYTLADVFYLPLDSKKNAARFISLINPEIAIFTKYEFWYHYFKTLHDRNIPLIMISGIFRPDQIFLKWYGGLHRKMLTYVTHYFVQNQESINLLTSLNVNQVSLSGDTRFDRVAENAASAKELALIKEFCGSAPVFIAGSTWPQDEALLKTLVHQYPAWKFIIAAHEIGADHIQQLVKLFPDALRYTLIAESKATVAQQVLLIDNIGLLSSVYQYGDIAYIGGGFGAGIHNTLEAAAFGLPVIFGPKYNKFQEAKDLLALGAAISIKTENDLSAAFEKLQKDHQAGPKAQKYVHDKTGSTAQIIKYLEKYV